MKKIIVCFVLILLFPIASHCQQQQGNVEMDAIAFVRDSAIQVEIYYSILQGALQFEKKGSQWVAPLKARSEIWGKGKAIAVQDIKKEKVFTGSKLALDSAKSSMLLDGTVLSGNFSSIDTAVLIFYSKNEKGAEVSDTIIRKFYIPVIERDKFFFGGIELASSLLPTTNEKNPFEKVGYIITPNPSKVFGVSNTKLNYYTELYIPQQDISPSTTCTITTRVLDGQTHEMFSNSHEQKLSEHILPLIGSIDIDGLPSDSYILEIIVKRGTTVEASMQKVFFFDSGMKLSEDQTDASATALDEETIYTTSDLSRMAELELREKGDQAMYIGTNEQTKAWKKMKNKLELDEAPPASDTARKITPAQKEDDISRERKFLFSFWRLKDKEMGTATPLTAYKAYYKIVDVVNKKFTYQKTPGWESDFGRVYLTYGAPDERNITQQLHSVDAKPYISWEYYDKNIPLVTGSHPLFVFVDRQGGGKFVLVHSNVQGEIYEPDWFTQEAAQTH